jgi:hypothetical protein
MSHILFIDESGQDLRESSYEVLAGIAIEDRDLWNLICRVQDAELEFFGRRRSEDLVDTSINTASFHPASGGIGVSSFMERSS